MAKFYLLEIKVPQTVEIPGVVVVIPSRYASTRFSGKPLIKIGGMTMIERVYRQAALKLWRV